MAGEDDLLNKLTALVAAFDDAAWEALASKGLLRRARKDLEKGLDIEIREQSPPGFIFRVARVRSRQRQLRTPNRFATRSFC